MSIGLREVVAEFNDGCEFLLKATAAAEGRDYFGYEQGLRNSANMIGTALEWALKCYLLTVKGNALSPTDRRVADGKAQFHELINLMMKYASPTFDASVGTNLSEHRTWLRNPVLHKAQIPSIERLLQAIGSVKDVLTVYLNVEEAALRDVNLDMDKSNRIDELKEDYFATLAAECEYMDLGGISPRVGSKVVKMKMESLFVPLRTSEDEHLFESVLVDSLQFGDVERPLEQFETDGSATTWKQSQPHGTAYLELGQFLERPRVVVVGHPGSGKTTIGKYVSLSIVNGRAEAVGERLLDYVPILLKSTDYSHALAKDAGLSLYEYIVTKHTVRYGELFQWALAQGLGLVIVDGLDEVADPRLRMTTSRRIEQFVNEFRDNRFLVTSRIVGYRQNRLTGDFFHLTLCEFGETEIKNFLEQWYRAIEVEAERNVSDTEIRGRAHDLWTAIEANPGIRKLAGNPLLLTIIALANWRGTKLPNRRVELYQIATETLIENWPLKQRGLALDYAEIISILEPIAYQMFASGNAKLISEHELQPQFERQVCEVRGVTSGEARTLSRELLQTIEMHTGFFLAKGHDLQGQNVYGFLHLTFAEYLTARWLAEKWSSGDFDLSKYAHEAQWHEVMLLMAGHVGTWALAQSTRLVGCILDLKSPYEGLIHRDLLLAADILADNVRVARDLHSRCVGALIELALSTQYPQLWYSCVGRLAAIRRSSGLGLPEQMLDPGDDDSDDLAARKASIAVALGARSDEAVAKLLSFLDTREPPRFDVTTAIFGFGEYGGTVSASHMIAVESSDGVSIREAGDVEASQISRQGMNTFGVNDLEKANVPVQDKGCRIWLIPVRELLGLGSSRVVELLRQQGWTGFLTSSALSVEDSAQRAFFSEILQQACSDSDPTRRIAALEGLDVIIGETAVRPPKDWSEILRGIAKQDPDPAVRLKAIGVISHLPGKGDEGLWIQLLKHSLQDLDEAVRMSAATLLLQTGTQDLSEPDFESVRAVLGARAQILSGRFSDDDIRYLLGEIADWMETGRSAWDCASDLLALWGKAESPEMVGLVAEQVCSLIRDIPRYIGKDEEVRWYPFWWRVVVSKARELSEAIAGLFVDLDPLVRKRAVVAWAGVRPKSSPLDALLPLLRDPDSAVREEAVDALTGEDANHEAVFETLLAMLQEPGDASRVPYLLSQVTEPELLSRLLNHVEQILGREHNQPAFTILWLLLGDTQPGYPVRG